mmetsp:Transcript_3835/g.11265  ORF Transcript_3835/g.11265 Transcript_3835/m.11265 type:complete len:220 (-) Transcript_3835:283-942(-)
MPGLGAWRLPGRRRVRQPPPPAVRRRGAAHGLLRRRHRLRHLWAEAHLLGRRGLPALRYGPRRGGLAARGARLPREVFGVGRAPADLGGRRAGHRLCPLPEPRVCAVRVRGDGREADRPGGGARAARHLLQLGSGAAAGDTLAATGAARGGGGEAAARRAARPLRAARGGGEGGKGGAARGERREGGAGGGGVRRRRRSGGGTARGVGDDAGRGGHAGG